MPKISVIVRLYNGIEYLEEAITSVLEQTFQDWDLYVGVNGHGETGGEIYQKACEIQARLGDKRIKVVNYPQVRGGAEALNALVSDAIAPWVAILDADDKWHPQKLEAQYGYLGCHPDVDVIGTLCQYFGERGGSPIIPTGKIDNAAFREGNPMINSSVVIRKCLATFVDRFGLDDYDLWIRLSLQGSVFFNVPFMLTYHRLHSDSYFNASKRQDVEGLRRYHYRESQN